MSDQANQDDAKTSGILHEQTYFDLEGATNVKLSNAKQHTQPSRNERGM
jgi:hypothetical protein